MSMHGGGGGAARSGRTAHTGSPGYVGKAGQLRGAERGSRSTAGCKAKRAAQVGPDTSRHPQAVVPWREATK